MRFENKVAIVTGADSGIGLATAKRLAQEGARVVLVARHEDKLQGAADKIKNAGGADTFIYACDVSKEDEVIACVRATLDKFGDWHVVVNNAGTMVFKPLEEHTEEDWMKVLHVDLMGAFYFTKQAFLRMKPGGALVYVSSVHAEMTTPMVVSYAAAKAATVSLCRSAAIEGKPKGLRANVVLPGAVDTPMLWDNPNLKTGAEHLDPQDVGKPEDIAATIAFLASDDAPFVQGATIRADGGRLDHL